MMAMTLRCDGLGKRFGTIRALVNLTLEISGKTSAGLVGPNGAGKTTLLSLLCGFTLPSSGRIEILGKRPGSASLAGRIGFLPQDIAMFRGISLNSQLNFYARLQGQDAKTARDDIDRVLSLTRAHALAKQYPETLSHGQRKKATLAQALIGQPDILLLDEPTAGLDPVAASEVRDIIQDLRKQQTLIISSHNLDEIKTVCDEIIIIDKGRLVKHCRIDELLASHNTLSILLQSPANDSLLHSIAEIPGVIRIDADHADSSRLVVVFQSDSPEHVQFSILETIRDKDITIMEFRRGGELTDRVIQLVSGNT